MRESIESIRLNKQLSDLEKIRALTALYFSTKPEELKQTDVAALVLTIEMITTGMLVK